LKENRAIVSSIAGTTRDTIEEVLNIDGVLFRLIDTAGIRESKDEIESIGVERSKEKMKSADLVVYLYDVHQTDSNELRSMQEELQQISKHWILVGNKEDDQQKLDKLNSTASSNQLFISAKFDYCIDALKNKLVNAVVHGNLETESTIVTNARHYQSLQKVADAMRSIQEGMSNRVPGDLLSVDIRQCLYHLGEITGTISNEDQLDYIFSKFCIGK